MRFSTLLKSRMKKNILLGFLFLSLNGAFSQSNWVEEMQNPSTNFYDVKNSFEDYWQNREVEKGKGWKQFKRWEYFIEPRVFPSGNRSDLKNIFIESHNYLQSLSPSPNQNRSLTGQWSYIGNNFVPAFGGGAGRIGCIAFHPNDNTIIFAGAPAGGLWKSTDAGATWTTQTNNLPSMGVSAIAIHPQNPDTIYIGTGDGDSGDTYSVGVLVSYDGGITFQPTGLSFNYSAAVTIRKLIINPDNPNILIAATNGGMYQTTDAGANWTQINTVSSHDLEFKPGNPQIVYASTTAKFWISTDAGATFTQILNGLPTSGMNRIAIGVTPADDDYIYLLSSAGDQGFYGLYRSTDGGTTFELRTDTPNLMGWETDGSDSGGQGWYDLAIVVSASNKDQLWTGGVNVWKSSDGGNTFALDAHWYGGGGQPYVHADIHAMEVIPGATNSFLIGCDGGIFKTTNAGTSYSDISNNLKIAQIYKFSQSATDPTKMISGWQDNGTNLKTTGIYARVLGGDGMDCAIDYSDNNVMYGEYYYGSIYKSENGGVNFDNIVNDQGAAGTVDEPGEWVTPLILHPTNPNIILVGKTNVYRSTNGGMNWNALGGTVAGGSGMIIGLTYAESNPDYIYAIKRNRVFSCSDGTTFANVTSNLSVTSSITNITVDPNNPLRAWVTYSGFSASTKVYYTNNGGTSWSNFSTGIPNIPVNCIVYENGTNDGLYIGTDMGVFYRNATHTSWQYFSEGLPNTIVNDLEIYYAGGKLRAATYGRGIWESDLFTNVENDASISAVEIPNGNVCNTSFSPEITLKNLGDNDLTTVEINYSIDGGSLVNYSWNGLLHPYDEIVLTLPMNSSVVGNHSFEIYTSNPNGTMDGNTTNDTLNTSYTITTNGNLVSFSIMPDCFGDQISWEIQNASSQVVVSVAEGFYEGSLVEPAAGAITITKEICLEAGCYDFIISDSEGNGLQGIGTGCSNNGTYSMNDQFENLLFEDLTTNGNFGNSETHSFCVTTGYVSDFSAVPTQICSGGDIQFNDLSTSGSTTWNWTFPGGNPASSSLQNPIINYAVGGNYDVILQVGNGTDSHTKTISGYITVYDSPMASVIFDSITCYGECNAMIDLSISGGTSPFYFDWSNNSNNEDLTSICAGNYSVMMMDDVGCKDSSDVIIYSPIEIIPALIATQATCGVNDGSINSNVTGGIPPYELLWSTTETNSSISGLGIGAFTLTVTDSLDCVVSETSYITNPNAPDVIANGINESCGDDCDGELNSFASGGTGILSYNWDNAMGTSDTIQMVCPGTYIISVVDQNFCEDRDTVIIGEGTIYPVANFVISDTTVAIGQNINFVNLSSNANQYEWSFGDGDSAFFSSTSHSYDTLGTYLVVLTSCKNNCCDSDTGYVYVMDVSSVGENFKNDWVKIYPNPTEDLVYIQMLKGNFDTRIKVYDNNGRKIIEKTSKEELTSIDISTFSKGIYFIEVNCYDTILRYKVVKR